MFHVQKCVLQTFICMFVVSLGPFIFPEQNSRCWIIYKSQKLFLITPEAGTFQMEALRSLVSD